MAANGCKPTLDEQRQLLQMQAELLRLKITAERLRQQRQTARQADWQQALSLLGNLPLSGLAVRAVTRSRRWRHKLLMAAAMGVLAWWRQQQQR